MKTRRGVYKDLDESPYIFKYEDYHEDITTYRFPSNAQLQKFIKLKNENETRIAYLCRQLERIINKPILAYDLDDVMVKNLFDTMYKQWVERGMINE